MKRLLSIVCLLAVLSLCACQPTPEKELIVKKDSDLMLEKAQRTETTPDSGTDLTDDGTIPATSSNAATGLRAEYDIPETYQFNATGRKGILEINVDADIFVPEADRLAIYRVEAADHTQEQVDALWVELIGDTEMWEMLSAYDGYKQTKEMLEARILHLKQLLIDPVKLDGYEMLTVAEAKEEIKKLEAQYAEAPEKNEEKRSYGELATLPLTAPGYTTEAFGEYTGFFAYERTDKDTSWQWWSNTNGKYLHVTNRTNLESTFSVFNENGTGFALEPAANAHFSFVDFSITFPGQEEENLFLPVRQNTILDDKLLAQVGLSPQEAIDQAQNLLDRANCGMTVSLAYLNKDGNNYHLYCERILNGVPVVAFENYTASHVEDDSDSPAYWGGYAGSWTYEALDIVINKNGIETFSWIAPLEIVETVNNDAKLLPFSEVAEIFEKMMMVKYEPVEENFENSHYYTGVNPDTFSFTIERVTLSLQRIAEKNSIQYGLLVPVWNFYITGGTNVPIGNSCMSINAIDGSIIDIAKGY